MNNPEGVTYFQECQKYISRDLAIKAKINRARNLINKSPFWRNYNGSIKYIIRDRKQNLEKTIWERNLHLIRTHTWI